MSYGALKIHYDTHNKNKEVWEPIHRNHLIHLDDLEILKQYNAEIRGLYNYYKIANNVSVLNNFNYVMKFSMFKTFGAKYQAHIGEIRDKYRIGKDFGVNTRQKRDGQHCCSTTRGSAMWRRPQLVTLIPCQTNISVQVLTALSRD